MFLLETLAPGFLTLDIGLTADCRRTSSLGLSVVHSTSSLKGSQLCSAGASGGFTGRGSNRFVFEAASAVPKAGAASEGKNCKGPR